MNDTTPVKNVLVFLALVASLPQVFKLERKGHWIDEETAQYVFTVWNGKVTVTANTYHGASSTSTHTLEQARELWARYKAEGFQALDNDVQVN